MPYARDLRRDEVDADCFDVWKVGGDVCEPVEGKRETSADRSDRLGKRGCQCNQQPPFREMPSARDAWHLRGGSRGRAYQPVSVGRRTVKQRASVHGLRGRASELKGGTSKLSITHQAPVPQPRSRTAFCGASGSESSRKTSKMGAGYLPRTRENM